MKKLAIFVLFLFALNSVKSQDVIFLHHSTGGNVYKEGNVPGWFEKYNAKHKTDYQITERSYPNKPYPWRNYPFDYWSLWVDGNCNSDSSGIECLESICEDYDVVIWKHCFPGAAVLESSDEGDITSSLKTLANYKEQYRALLEKMDELNDTKFVVWTLAPLHRLSTGSVNRMRAKEFVDWVNNEWLQEDGKDHPNIYIFDFFSLAAEQDENPENGLQYCLKYEYERSHEKSDSHPNKLANETIGPKFAQQIVDVIQDK